MLACYHGDGGDGDGVHLLGPLSKKVVRVAPPLVITQDEAAAAVSIIARPPATLDSPHAPTRR